MGLKLYCSSSLIVHSRKICLVLNKNRKSYHFFTLNSTPGLLSLSLSDLNGGLAAALTVTHTHLPLPQPLPLPYHKPFSSSPPFSQQTPQKNHFHHFLSHFHCPQFSHISSIIYPPRRRLWLSKSQNVVVVAAPPCRRNILPWLLHLYRGECSPL